MHVLIACRDLDAGQAWLKRFATALPDARVSLLTPDITHSDAEVVISWQPPADLLERVPNLRAIFALSAGIDALLALPGLPPNLPIVRLEDAGMARQMVEYTLHALWEQSRGFATYRQQQAEQQWQPLRSVRRADWPVGILGLGALGSAVARAVAGFGYPVLGWSRSGSVLDGVKTFSGPDQLNSFLARTRVLVNLLPLTPETRGLLAAPLFAALPAGASLIQLARGAHLVDDDLIAALDSGHLAHATLDVMSVEPLPPEHPFWRHPNITLTPHVAAQTLPDDAVAQITHKLRQWRQGQTVSGVVMRERGY